MCEETRREHFFCDITEDCIFPGCLVLSDASDVYLELRGWDRSYIGSEIEAIYNYRDAICIEKTLRQLENGSEALTYFREIGGITWRIDAAYRKGGIHYESHRVCNPAELNSYAQTCRLGHEAYEFLQSTRVDTVLLKDVGGLITVADISRRLSNLTGLSPDSGLAIAWHFLYCMNPERVAAACLRTNTGTRYTDMYIRGGTAQYVLLEYSPLKHDNGLVAVSVHKLTEKEFFALQTPFYDLSPQAAPIRDSAAYAIYGVDGDDFILRRYNRIFADLNCSGTIKEKLGSLLLRPCSDSGEVKCTLISLVEARYFCIATRVENSSVHLTMLRFNEFQSGVEECLSILSPREREVTLFLMDGLSTHDIARRLVIADGTVKKTVSNVYAKLGVKSKIELMHLVLQYES